MALKIRNILGNVLFVAGYAVPLFTWVVYHEVNPSRALLDSQISPFSFSHKMGSRNLPC